MKDALKALDFAAAGGLVAAVAALALWSLARHAGPVYSRRAAQEGGTPFLSEGLMHRACAIASDFAGICVRCGVGADALSWTSLFFGLGAGVAAGGGLPGIAAWLLSLAGFCDMLDGTVARATGTAGARGAALDSALDRYVEFFFCAGLVVWFSGSVVLQLLAVAALFGGMMVTYSTAKAEALGIAPPRGWMKRPERIVWMIGGAFAAAIFRGHDGPRIGFIAGALAVIAVFANASAIRRLGALRSHLA